MQVRNKIVNNLEHKRILQRSSLNARTNNYFSFLSNHFFPLIAFLSTNKIFITTKFIQSFSSPINKNTLTNVKLTMFLF